MTYSISSYELERILAKDPDLKEYRYHILGFLGEDCMHGQGGDTEQDWTYLCEDLSGKPCFIKESYYIEAVCNPGPSYLYPEDFYSAYIEELTPEEAADYRRRCKPVEADDFVSLPLTPKLKKDPRDRW